MIWHRKILQENIKETFSSVLFYILILIFLGAQRFFLGDSFSWVWIEPIEQPSIFMRIFYSALTFLTLGKLVYKTKFYFYLYRIIGNYWVYKKAKKNIWVFLMLIMFFIIVPIIVNLLNGVISIVYNVFIFLLYILPSLTISTTIVGIYFYFRRKDKIGSTPLS